MRKFLLLVLLLGPVLAQDDESEIEIDVPPTGEPDQPTPKQPGAQPGKPVDPKIPLQERINTAIETGVAWLKQSQLKDGSFGPCVSSGVYGSDVRRDKETYLVGPTAFAVFTLRKCGVPRRDPVIKKAVKWLKKTCRTGWNPDLRRVEGTQIQGKGIYYYTTYESSALIMMLVALNKKDLRKGVKPKPIKLSKSPTIPSSGFKRDEWKWMHERVQFLISNPHGRMNAAQVKGGGWRYYPPNREADSDLSATQFALLGLRDAVSAGYPVHMLEPNTWLWAADGARRFQHVDGAFSYRQDTPWSAGMTAAGIACLLICKEQIGNLGQTPPDWLEEQAQAGLEFLGKQLDFTRNRRGPTAKDVVPEGVGYHFYHLYGIERVGALSGKHEIGGKAWYPRGAKWLVDVQMPNGSWLDPSCMRPKDVLGTCFALLFLKKATPPTVTVTER